MSRLTRIVLKCGSRPGLVISHFYPALLLMDMQTILSNFIRFEQAKIGFEMLMEALQKSTTSASKSRNNPAAMNGASEPRTPQKLTARRSPAATSARSREPPVHSAPIHQNFAQVG